MVRLVLLLILLLPWRAGATSMTRVLSFDIGGGVPTIVNADVQVLVARHWQIGFGYGFVPGLSNFGNLDIPDQNLTLAGIPFSFAPELKTSFDMLTPFIRFYPTERNFYFQFAFPMLRMNLDINGLIKDAGGFPIGGAVTGGMTVWQPLPTISLGHVFASKAYFINFSLGVSFLISPFVSITLNPIIPDALGGADANQAALDQFKSSIQTSLNQAVDEARKQVFLLPSILLTAGLFL